MDNILVGTASWTDKTLIECGRFYPKDCKSAEARLRYYASQFPLVEVDSSYYGMPTPANAQLWAQRTPPGFVFNVKAFRLFTGHQTSPDVLHHDLRAALGPSPPRMMYYRDVPDEIRDELWRRFLEALAPLQAAGRLGAVHFQFAPWLVRGRDAIAHLRHCVERMAGHRFAVEFRHRSWFERDHAQDTLALERELGVVHTVVDAPQGFANAVPDVWEVTDPALAIVRLHGRNAASWNIKGAASASSRFDYLYSQQELAAMVPRVRRLAGLTHQVHVLFNTNYEDQGQAAARLMRKLLTSRAGQGT